MRSGSGFNLSIQLYLLFVFRLAAAIVPRKFNCDCPVVLYGSNCGNAILSARCCLIACYLYVSILLDLHYGLTFRADCKSNPNWV